MTQEIYYEVTLKRVTESVGKLIVRAATSEAAADKAKARTESLKYYETRKAQYEICSVEVMTELECLEPNALEGYRAYLREVAGDFESDLSLVVTFEEWKRDHRIAALYRTLQTYGVQPAKVSLLIRACKLQEMVELSCDLFDQVTYLVESQGFTLARKKLLSTLLLKQQDWPDGYEHDEPESDNGNL